MVLGCIDADFCDKFALEISCRDLQGIHSPCDLNFQMICSAFSPFLLGCLDCLFNPYARKINRKFSSKHFPNTEYPIVKNRQIQKNFAKVCQLSLKGRIQFQISFILQSERVNLLRGLASGWLQTEASRRPTLPADGDKVDKPTRRSACDRQAESVATVKTTRTPWMPGVYNVRLLIYTCNLRDL